MTGKSNTLVVCICLISSQVVATVTPGQSQPDVTVLRPELNCLAQDSMQLAAALLEHYLLPPPTPMSRAYHSNTSEPNKCGTSKGSQVNTHVACVLGGAIHIYRERREEVQVKANHTVQPSVF